MDLNNRSFRPNQQPNPSQNEPTNVSSQSSAGSHSPKKPSKLSKFKPSGVLSVTYVFLLFSVTIVLVGVLLTLVFFKNTSREERFVDTTKYQAIFLNNGQVYFGNINELNRDYLSLSDIYYLRVNQQVQPDQQASQNDVSLVKLGCELHGPQDNMVVNRDQVTFWENLKDDGQVAKAVAEYQKANPNGQNCEQQAQNAPAAPAATETKPDEETTTPTPRPSTNNNNASDTPAGTDNDPNSTNR